MKVCEPIPSSGSSCGFWILQMTNHTGLGEGLGPLCPFRGQPANSQPRATSFSAPSAHEEGASRAVGRFGSGRRSQLGAGGLGRWTSLAQGQGPPSLPGSIRDSQPAPKHCWVRRGPPPHHPAGPAVLAQAPGGAAEPWLPSPTARVPGDTSG